MSTSRSDFSASRTRAPASKRVRVSSGSMLHINLCSAVWTQESRGVLGYCKLGGLQCPVALLSLGRLQQMLFVLSLLAGMAEQGVCANKFSAAKIGQRPTRQKWNNRYYCCRSCILFSQAAPRKHSLKCAVGCLVACSGRRLG